MLEDFRGKSINEKMFFYILISSILLSVILIVEIITLDYPIAHTSTWIVIIIISSLGIYSNFTNRYVDLMKFIYFAVMIFFVLPFGWLYSDVMSPFPLVYALVLLIAVGNLLVGKMRVFYSISLMVISIIMLYLGLVNPELFPVIEESKLIKDIVIQIPITFGVCMFLLISFSNDLRAKNARLENTTTRDYLTGLYNRRYIYKYLDKKQRSFNQGLEIIVGVIDVNKFKQINDTYGHVVGDRVLICIANHIQSICGTSAIISRTGGDEFVIVMNYTSEFNMKNFMNKFQCTKVDFTDKDMMDAPKITISGGFIICNIKTPIDTMIAKADQNMYQAKADKKIYNAKAHEGNGIIFTRE